MPTAAELIKTELDAGGWGATTYGTNPGSTVEGTVKRKYRTKPKKGIILKDQGEDPIFTTNEMRIYSPMLCELRMTETSPTARDNLFTAIRTIFQASSFSIIFSNVRPENKELSFTLIMKVQILN